MNRGLIFILGLLLFSSLVAVASTYGAVSEEEARNRFTSLGCTSCHRPGGVARSWDEIISNLRSWGRQYQDIDEAVSNEVIYLGNIRFNSFDELMAQMQRNVGASDSDMAMLKEFFQAVFRGEVADTPVADDGGQGGMGIPMNMDTTSIVLAVVVIVIVVVAIAYIRTSSSK